MNPTGPSPLYSVLKTFSELNMIETISRQEWLDRNPVLKRYIASDPIGWQTVPAFNLWPDVSEIEGISDHQREQLGNATAGRIGILGGSPGTGKTFTVAKLIRHMLDRGLIAAHDIGIGAPTGKAAVRLTEVMQSPGNRLPLRAKTWHSLLGIGANSETGGWSFAHNESAPWPFRLLIGDESSMMDLSLMLAVMRARQVGCHVLFVGDVNQLPPVGAGAPLRDMIAAGLPYGELREIKRNSGGIVEACAAIRDSLPWLDMATASESNLIIHQVDDQERKVGRIKDLLFGCERDGLDPVWGCQVLVAVNESSPLSRKLLNAELQEEFNQSPKVEGTIFRQRDKVVCLKNGWYLLSADMKSGPVVQMVSVEVKDAFLETMPKGFTKKQYFEYLNSFKWKAKRLRVKRERNYKCDICGVSESTSTGPLELHHRTYERIGDERDEDLELLCRKCHGAEHADNTEVLITRKSSSKTGDEVYVANGELGEVIEIDDRQMVIKLESPSREVIVPFRKQSSDDESDNESKGAVSNWDLGYALSVHKSQGSEWPVVIVALDSYAGAKLICDRAWLYTAISRAKSKCFLVGPGDLAERFCRVQKISTRKTMLRELIQREQFLREVEGL